MSGWADPPDISRMPTVPVPELRRPTSPLALPVEKYGSHLVPLLGALANTSGPVLECGTGLFSTPILHTLCAPTRRRLVSLETDGAWMEKFVELRRPWHEVTLIDDWAKTLTQRPEPEWAVVLVDNNPHESRQDVLTVLANKAIVLVLHDSQCCDGGFDGWHVFRDQQPYLGLFKYKRHFEMNQERYPRTTLLSNRVPLDVFDIVA